MKLERSKDWWMTRARREGAAAIGAGLLAFDPAPEQRLLNALCMAGGRQWRCGGCAGWPALAVAGEDHAASQHLRQDW